MNQRQRELLQRLFTDFLQEHVNDAFCVTREQLGEMSEVESATMLSDIRFLINEGYLEDDSEGRPVSTAYPVFCKFTSLGISEVEEMRINNR